MNIKDQNRGWIFLYDEFKGKVALVTGGTSGIGKATAFAFAEQGARVIISGRNVQKGEKAVEEASERGLNIEFICSDVSKPDDVKKMISQIVKKYGCIDIAFNNAGIDGQPTSVMECDEEDWLNVINTNLNGEFYCLKYETIEMNKNGGGVIVNMLSASAHTCTPRAAAYVASKHALVGLTKSAAMACADKNIRINGISPGLIKTSMTIPNPAEEEEYCKWVSKVTPIKRIGKPEEVAETVLWLCSSKASFVTGEIIKIDGGLLAGFTAGR